MENIIWTVSPFLLFLGAFLRMFLAGLWYSPVLFGRRWMRLMKFTPEYFSTKEFHKASKRNYIISIAIAIIISYVVGVVVQTVAPINGQVVLTILVIMIGFTLPLLINRHLWDRQPWGLFPIHAGFELICFILTGLIHSI